MMRVKTILGAAIIATTPFAASAVTLSPDNNITDGETRDVSEAPFQWNASFDDGETETGIFGPDGLEFSFTNNNFGTTALTFAITTINQFEDGIAGTSDYYFTEGIIATLGGESVTLGQGESGNFTLSTEIATGGSTTLSFDFGQAVAEGGVGPDIDFRVTAAPAGAPIPVPAALPLLGAALGGLGLAARRRKKV